MRRLQLHRSSSRPRIRGKKLRRDSKAPLEWCPETAHFVHESLDTHFIIQTGIAAIKFHLWNDESQEVCRIKFISRTEVLDPYHKDEQQILFLGEFTKEEKGNPWWWVEAFEKFWWFMSLSGDNRGTLLTLMKKCLWSADRGSRTCMCESSLNGPHPIATVWSVRDRSRLVLEGQVTGKRRKKKEKKEKIKLN